MLERRVAAETRSTSSAQADEPALGVVEKPLTAWERLYGNAVIRKTAILLFLAFVWEIGARRLDNELIFPTFLATLRALAAGLRSGVLLQRTAYSLHLLLQGYGTGLVLAALLTALATATRLGTDLLETLTAMFNPLPSIALLPLAMLWFGLGRGSLVFVLVHAVLWAVALNTHAGFRGVSQTLRMVGRNYGLGGLRYVAQILVPAALPSILTGLKIGWAFAWRTLIAAELIFGVSTGSGGLGWFVFENKNQLETPNVFAGLLTVILIGLGVENLVFRLVERATIHKWGMSH